MMKPKLSLVTLGVRDLDAALAFYRDGLGWPIADGSGYFATPTASSGKWRTTRTPT